MGLVNDKLSTRALHDFSAGHFYKTMPRFKKDIPYEIIKLGEYLQRLRQEVNLSIRYVARECKMAPSWLSKFEQGKTFKTIGVETLARLSRFYKIPMCDMLKEVGFTQHEHDDGELPGLFEYFRRKFHLPAQAIRDIEMTKDLVEKKYSQFQSQKRK